MKKKFNKIIYIVLIVLMIISLLYIFSYFYDIYNSKNENYMIDRVSVNEVDENIVLQNETATEDEASPIVPDKTDRMLKLEELQKENADVVGWIEIENTDISYPVLQGTDNSYYMTHNYKKGYSFNGSIFLDKDYVWNPPSSNLLIYGHNNKNNTMFQELLKYKNKSFYEQHPLIRFTTNMEDVNYEIISAFESRVYYKSEQNVFRYYYFVNSENEQEYYDFVDNVKNSSLYDTGKTAVYGDQLMTLSTCSYHTKNGRFVVVARKLQFSKEII